ncbi:2-succinyl-6-hydroxy-2,4-cyclohexadiene-1-carboxylate synthase [candidate division GN15 bacterium]|nr:2-succinyl-6-hydroxy-2,4-cyclohexadiene-1-carboxylate synthase [candidate division GN15 bacterium]
MPDQQPSLAYRTYGRADRPPVLCLHGFAGDSDDWTDVGNALAVQRFVIAVDLPGHGESVSVDDKHFPMPACASAVIEVLDYLEIDRTDLIAYSMGGRLGLYLLTVYPDRFGKALLESTSPGLRTEEERSARRQLDDDRATEIEHGSLTAFFMKWFDQPIFTGMRRRRDAFERMLTRRLAGSSAGLAKSLRLMGTGAQPSLWDNLPGLHHPIRLVAGQFDGKFRAIAEQMADLCPAAEVRIISDCGHNVHFEQPAAFYREIETFLLEETGEQGSN